MAMKVTERFRAETVRERFRLAKYFATFYGVPMALLVAEGHERRAVWGRPPGLQSTASSAPQRMADQRSAAGPAACPTWTFDGAVRAASNP